jgi:hypothetical protein
VTGLEVGLGMAGLAVPVLGAVAVSLVRGGQLLERIGQVHAQVGRLHDGVDRLEQGQATIHAQVDGLHVTIRDHQAMPASVAHG